MLSSGVKNNDALLRRLENEHFKVVIEVSTVHCFKKIGESQFSTTSNEESRTFIIPSNGFQNQHLSTSILSGCDQCSAIYDVGIHMLRLPRKCQNQSEAEENSPNSSKNFTTIDDHQRLNPADFGFIRNSEYDFISDAEAAQFVSNSLLNAEIQPQLPHESNAGEPLPQQQKQPKKRKRESKRCRIHQPNSGGSAPQEQSKKKKRRPKQCRQCGNDSTKEYHSGTRYLRAEKKWILPHDVCKTPREMYERGFPKLTGKLPRSRDRM